MRDAFGGSFMIMIFLVFIMIYISFTAVALNYAKAFKVKNAVISYMENSEITSLDQMTVKMEDDFKKFLDEEIVGNYNYQMNRQNFCAGYPKKTEDGRTVAICNNVGIIIEESSKAENTEGHYYTVNTYLGWDIGFFRMLSSLNGDNEDPEIGEVRGYWNISGETRLIVNKN